MEECIIKDEKLKYEYAVYKNGDVYNITREIKLKPFKDKRRPNEPPIIYLRKKDDSREFIYHDELVMKCFNSNYNPKKMNIIHIDGDVMNCSFDNLYANHGINTLSDIYGETKRWEKVNIDTKLYYDYFICEDGRLYNATTDTFIKSFRDNREQNYGYLRYNLYRSKSIKDVIHVSVARLVAIHFIPKPDGKDIIIYKDNDYNNVDASNLYWGDSYDMHTKHIEVERDFKSIKIAMLGVEKWKPLTIEAFEYDYLVSNFGRVYNDTKQYYCTQSSGNTNHLNQSYKTVHLYTINYGFKEYFVHRLVATLFVKNSDPDFRTVVNHINGNPECNLAINLEWVSPFDNLHHAICTNLAPSSLYKSRVTDKHWRLNTYYAWVFSIPNMTIQKAYDFYIIYQSMFIDDLPEKLSLDEFTDIYEYKCINDPEYIRLAKFYNENYGKV